MAGTIVAGTISDGTNSTNSTDVIKGSARAWICMDTQSDTIHNSYNVSSLTDGGQSAYYVNITNQAGHGVYSAVAACNLPYNGSNGSFVTIVSQTSSQLRLGFVSAGSSYYTSLCNVAMFW